MKPNNFVKVFVMALFALTVFTFKTIAQTSQTEVPNANLNSNVDITSNSGVTVNTQGTIKLVPFGESITIQSNHAFKKSKDGKFAFNISFAVENIGSNQVNKPFICRVILDDNNTISEVYGVELGSNEKKVFNSQIYLPLGNHKLTLVFDQDKETNDQNSENNTRTINVEVAGNTPTSSWK